MESLRFGLRKIRSKASAISKVCQDSLPHAGFATVVLVLGNSARLRKAYRSHIFIYVYAPPPLPKDPCFFSLCYAVTPTSIVSQL